MSFAPLPTIAPLHACETVGRYVDVVDPVSTKVPLPEGTTSRRSGAKYRH